MIKYYNENEITNKEIIQMYSILIENLFITYPKFLKERDKHDNKENFQNWSNMIKNTKNYYVLTYEEDNKIIGFFNFSIINQKLWISEIQIKESFKKKGVMTKLINYFISLDICKNYDTITIHINDENKISKNVFMHIGFKSIGNTLYEISMNDLLNYIKK